MSLLKTLGNRWGWPAVVGMIFGIGAGFYFFWTGQLLQVAPYRTFEIITAVGTLLGGLGAAAAAWIAFYASLDSKETGSQSVKAATISAEAAKQSADVAVRIASIQDWNFRRNAEFAASTHLDFEEGGPPPVLRFEMENPVTCFCRSAVWKVHARYYSENDVLVDDEAAVGGTIPVPVEPIAEDGILRIDVGELINWASRHLAGQYQLPFALLITCEFCFAKGTRFFSRDVGLVVDWQPNEGWYVRMSDWTTVKSQVRDGERITRACTGVLADMFPYLGAVGPFLPDLEPPGGQP